MIRPALLSDADAISNIYNHYVLHTVVTFEEIPVTVADMELRMTYVQDKYAWLVWEDAGNIAGFAYAGDWKTRTAYRHTVEASIYLDPRYTGRGIGKKLYSALMSELAELKIHAVIGGIALPNDASIKLHENLGFKPSGILPEVGWKFDRWVDVGYWVLLL